MFEHFIHSWYPSYFLISAVFMAGLGLLSLRYKDSFVAKYFVIFMFLNAFQSIFSIFEITSTNVNDMIWWRNFQQIPLFVSPLVLLICTMEYVGLQYLLKKIKILLFMPITIYLFLIFTDQIHHLMRKSIEIAHYGSISKLIIQSTNLSQIFIAYGYLMVFLTLFLLLFYFRKIPKEQWKQTLYMIFIVSVIILYSLVVGIFKLPVVDFKALLFIPLGIVIYFGIKRQNLYSVYPIAKDIIIDHITDGIIVLDMNYKIVDFNRAVQKMVLDFTGVSLQKGNKVHSNEALLMLQEYRETGKTKYEFSKTVSGHLVEYDVTFSSVLDKQEKQIGFLIVLYDVTEAKKLTRELEKSQRVRLGFISNISHDIKNPLTSIIGFSEAILNGKAAADNTKVVQYIHKRSIFILELVQDLLYLSRLETRSIPFEFSVKDAKSFFERLFQGIQEEVMTTGNSFEYELAIDRMDIEIDTKRMERVVHNLIHNALKYTEKQDAIKARVLSTGEFVEVAIEDAGIGIDPDLTDKIFERYYTDMNHPTSHGLGLAICKEIIEIHRGTIGVKSNPGTGSTFYFTLPIRG
ncbi:histidine kinase N-terminal 7TM domain-containing protein [Bacillaceae bacterium S4-13-58]